MHGLWRRGQILGTARTSSFTDSRSPEGTRRVDCQIPDIEQEDERLAAPPEDGGDIKDVELIPSASTAGGNRGQEIRMP